MESAGEHGQLVLTEIPHVQEVQAQLFQLVEDEQARARSISLLGVTTGSAQAEGVSLRVHPVQTAQAAGGRPPRRASSPRSCWTGRPR